MYFPFLFRNIPAAPTYRVYIFQLIFQKFPIKYRNQINKEKGLMLRRQFVTDEHLT